MEHRFSRGRLVALVCLLWWLGWHGQKADAADSTKAAEVVRDWRRYPAVLKVETSADLYVVGDVHGDYERLVDLLATNRILSNKPAEPVKAQ
jgi:hypothetical protein